MLKAIGMEAEAFSAAWSIKVVVKNKHYFRLEIDFLFNLNIFQNES